MKITRLLTTLSVALLGAGSLLAQPASWKDIVKPPMHQMKVQQPKRIQLANGMVIFLQEDHELPLISGSATIRGGSREEPAGKVGLVDIYGDVWRTGGTKTKTGDELDDYLEARAAKVETGGDTDSTSVSFDSLKANFEDVWPVFLDVLRNPAFRDDKIAIAKSQMNTGIARRNDSSQDIARREAVKLAYGASSPYARTAEYATVAAITRDDLVAWHDRYVHPNNMILGIVGDFDPVAMEARLRKAFESWPKGAEASKKPDVAIQPAKPGVYLVDKNDVTQSEVRMVHLGTTRDNPDYYAIEVMNEILGGGFSSRLVNNIRTKLGLAYSVGGGVRTSFDHPGIFSLSLGTKSNTTAQAIGALYTEITNLQTKPIESTELARAKESILNSFVFAYDSKEKILDQAIMLEFYGYPADWLERYQAGIGKVTTEDVSRVANKYIHPKDVSLLVVGKASDFDKPLMSFGTVTPVDITIPQPGPAKPAAAPTAATSNEGRALMQKVVQWMGGKQNLAAIKSLREKTTLAVKTPQGDMTMQNDDLVILPDRARTTVTLPMGTMTMVVAGNDAWMVSPMGNRDLPASQRDSMLKQNRQIPYAIAQRADDPNVTFATAGTEKIGAVNATILDITADGSQLRWFVNPADGAILRIESQVNEMGVSGTRAFIVEETKTVSGVRFPSKFAIQVNGQDFGSGTVDQIEVNPKFEATEFQRPPAK